MGWCCLIDFNDTASVQVERERFDLDLIVQRLRESAETWVPRLFPNGRRSGDEWRLANIKGDAPRKIGSCVIKLRGAHAGDFIDFDGNQGGGPIRAIQEVTGAHGRALIAEAAQMAGVAPGAPARLAAATPPQPKRDPAPEIAHILSAAQPIAGTPAAAYLSSRGLAIPDTSDLLFHPDLTHWETKTGYPAMLGQVRACDGAVIGLHRTYLASDNEAVTKAPIAKPKMMLGRVAGGTVRLAAIGADGVLGLCEGIETGLAVMTACPGLAVWAALSTSGLEQIELPPEARRILILADNDSSGAGLRAAESAARRLREQRREVAIAMPPSAGEDFNDMLLRDGPAAIQQTLSAAPSSAEGSDATTDVAGQNRPVGFVVPQARLPQLRADEGDLARAHTRSWAVLLESNRIPWLFRCAGLPSWVVQDDDGLPMARPLTEDRLRHMLAKLADWRRIGRNGDLVPAHPPSPLIKSLLATPDPGLPVLTGIVTAPVFGRRGALLTEAGYHPDARLLYQPAPGFVLPPVPERPSTEEIASARRLITEDMLGEFPFTGPGERAHAVALLLLGFLRAMIDAPTPLHLIEKPTPGTGATLMVDAIATVLTGVGASVMTEGRDDEEWRKRVTAKLRQIPSIVLIDNLRHPLDSSALAAALTAPFWEDRILGASEMTRLPIRCVWIATGNNPEFSNEMARRIVRIRLDARIDQPWRREGFRHPDLITWVRANRPRLVAACLTLCQAWIAAGRPHGTRMIGSYETWSRVLGGVLEVAGIDGFLSNLDEMLAAADGEGAVWRSFVGAWWARFGTAEVGTGDLFEVAQACEPPLPLGTGGERSQRTRLGKALGRMRDRVFDVDGYKLRVCTSGVSHQAKRWQLLQVGERGERFPEPKIEGERGERFPRPPEASGGERLGEEGNVVLQRSPAQPIENIERGERGERGERFSILTHARARPRYRGYGKTFPTFPTFP